MSPIATPPTQWNIETALFHTYNALGTSQWEVLVKGFESLEREHRDKLLQASPGEVLSAQGEAKLAAAIVDLLHDARARATAVRPATPTPSTP